MTPWVDRMGRGGRERHEAKERSLDAVTGVVERFVHDLARLIAGNPVDFGGYVDAAVAAWLVRAVDPFLESGDAMRPDFGDYGELRLDGDLLDHGRPVIATLDFDDQSVRETAAGDLVTLLRRRVTLTLTVDPRALRVLDVRVTAAPAVA